MSVRVLVLTGEGLNCESETAYAFKLAGANPQIIHVRDLFAKPDHLRDFQILAITGGFSYGDHLGAGNVLASMMKRYLGDEIERFIAADRLVIGICNGFQVLARTGILPGVSSPLKAQFSLISNDVGSFENRWVHLRVHPKSTCLWTRGIETLYLPVRHGEGKFFTPDTELINHMENSGKIALQYTSPDTQNPVMEYPHNPNGSILSIAAVSNDRGNVLGMMPHPEAYLFEWQHPQYALYKGNQRLNLLESRGMALFKNAVKILEEN